MDLATIQKRIAMIEQFEQEMKVAKDALRTELENDPSYTETANEAKEVIKKRNRIKAEVMSRDHNQKLLEDIRANTEEIATLNEILSTELIAHYQETQTDEITDQDGALRKFKMSVKLLPKRD